MMHVDHVKKPGLCWLIAMGFTLICAPATGHAQAGKAKPKAGKSAPAKAKAKAKDKADSAQEALDADEIAAFADDGTNDRPNNRQSETDTVAEPTAAVRPGLTGAYPIALRERPLTLGKGMSQVALSLPVALNVDPFGTNGLLAAAYGITQQIEVGLDYGLGGLNSDGFIAGKAVAVRGTYLVTNEISISASVPILLDPFSLGLTLGVPMRFSIGDKLALIVGRDLLSIKVKRFVPVVADALQNDAMVKLDELNTSMDNGALRLLGGVIYQHAENLSVVVESGFVANDFGTSNGAPVPLQATGVYSLSNMLDVGGRIGFGDLGDAVSSFAVGAFSALRI